MSSAPPAGPTSATGRREPSPPHVPGVDLATDHETAPSPKPLLPDSAQWVGLDVVTGVRVAVQLTDDPESRAARAVGEHDRRWMALSPRARQHVVRRYVVRLGHDAGAALLAEVLDGAALDIPFDRQGAGLDARTAGERVIAILRPVARVLSELHASGWMLGDLGADDILVTPLGSGVVTRLHSSVQESAAPRESAHAGADDVRDLARLACSALGVTVDGLAGATRRADLVDALEFFVGTQAASVLAASLDPTADRRPTMHDVALLLDAPLDPPPVSRAERRRRRRRRLPWPGVVVIAGVLALTVGVAAGLRSWMAAGSVGTVATAGPSPEVGAPLIVEAVSALQAVVDRRTKALTSADPAALSAAVAPGSAQHEGDHARLESMRTAQVRYIDLRFVVRQARLASQSGDVAVVSAVVERSAFTLAGPTGADRQALTPDIAIGVRAGERLDYTLRWVQGAWLLVDVASSRMS